MFFISGLDDLFGGSSTTTIIILIIIIAVVIFAIVSSILNKKNQKLEKERRKKDVKAKIKEYIRQHENQKNLRIEYEKVVSRKGKEYKYRDVFDVIVDIYEAKTNELIAQKAYEIEGISHKVSKKQYETNWVINGELDVEQTQRQIDIAEKKIKLTKDEIKQRKIEAKKAFEEAKQQENERRLEERRQRKAGLKKNIEEERPRVKVEKFRPRK